MRFEIRINAADMLPRPARDHAEGRVLVVFAGYDEAMRQPSHPISATLTPEQFAAASQGLIRVHEAIPVATTIRKIRVIVSDEELGAVGSVTVPIRR